MRDTAPGRALANAEDALCGLKDAVVRRVLARDEKRSLIGMLHDVLPAGAESTDPYACRVDALTRYIAAKRSEGFRFVSLDRLLSPPASAHAHGEIALTFDDGYASMYTVLLPVLTTLRVPFTVYVTSGALGKPGYLTRPQLILLAASGPHVAIGSHSVTHPKFRFLSEAAARRELTESREALSALVFREVSHFAFPHGGPNAVCRRDIALARGAGYQSVALTGALPLTEGALKNPYRLPRLNLTGALRACAAGPQADESEKNGRDAL